MSITVMNNTASNLVLGELNRNNNKLSKSLKKISSGMRLSDASENSSDYAISEKMRAMIRSLGQDIENSKKGISLVKTAEGGICGIIDSLRTMKELALNSLNDHNSDEDRKILQKEFSSRMEEIEELASTTNYNGIILLDGRWRQLSGEGETVTHIRTETVTEYETVTEPYTETITTYEDVTEEYTETVTTYEEVTEEYPYTYTKTTEKPLESHAVRPLKATPTGVLEPNGISQRLGIAIGGGDQILRDGCYFIPKGFTGTINISAQNVKLIQEDPSTTLQDVYIVTSSSGNTNLWIENLNIQHTKSATPSFIKFQGSNNVLTLKNRTIFSSSTGKIAAFINVGQGLTIEGRGSIDFHEGAGTVGASGAFIGSDFSEKSSANIVINSGRFTTSSSKTGCPWGQTLGAVIGSGYSGSIGDIIINGGTFDLFVGGGGACIGGGNNGTTGNISIQDARIKAQCDDGACIGSGCAGGLGVSKSSSTGYIYILNSDLDLRNTELAHSGWEDPSGVGAAIGGGGTFDGSVSSVGDITVENSTVKAVTDRGAGIGTGGDSEYGGTGKPHAYGILTKNSTLDITVNDSRAEKIGKGVNGIIPVDYVEEEVTEMRTRTVTVPHETTVTSIRTYTIPHEVTRTVEYQEELGFAKNPLVIHTGPKANQHLRLHINDMRTKALGLEGTAVDPQEKAKEALEKVDSAVEYALNENVRMGAYQMRLAETIDNLIIAQENTIHSEITIRDADMAKEMMDYTRNNILVQSAQAMLAQANQNSSDVLNLLQ